ncbi:cysteine peptidase family C39 domain-containing protein [Dactylosporangium sp. CA-152071]|uniref:cysteine peptidase family C39 domain-containing protein n=1 Tax=Dactylosporangium sp. CA-152071 TaxID=3239933 RepID=UPI003D8A3A25
MRTRRLLAPEVVQTSTMDCGPATLTSLLAGFGIRAGYARLRDACQTDVDGTSIDALEDAAAQLGLQVQQVMLPADHLELDAAGALPAIVVSRNPDGLTHFVVVWRRHGGLLQIMDPAVGRRWVPAAAFRRDELYLHEFGVPADAFERWIRSAAFGDPLRALLSRVRVPGTVLDDYAARDGWQPLAALDAATRQAAATGLRGEAAVRALADDPASIADEHWFARPEPSPELEPDAEPDGTGTVTIRGAVLVAVRGRAGGPPDPAALPPDLRAALAGPDPAPSRFLWERLRGLGRLRLVAVAAGAVLAAAGVLAEVVLVRALLSADPGRVVPALVALAVALLALDGVVAGQVAAAGRRLEQGLRTALAGRLPRLPDRYIRSRPLSDLAERAHRLHRLRELPALVVDAARTGTLLLLLPVVIGLVDPRSALPAACAAVLGTLAGWLFLPVQAERDLRMRSHVGAIARCYLDALTGLTAIRAHRAETVVQGMHERMLGPWAAAVRAVHRTAAAADLVQGAIGLGCVAWLLAGASSRVTDPAALLLLVYWAAAIPALGQQLAVLARRFPGLRSVTLRLVEPFATPAITEPPATIEPPAAADRPHPGGTRLRLRDVEVVAGGRPILSVTDLDVPAGAQVAVVGRSGSGKSTLAGLLLGWHTAAAGVVEVDGIALDAAALRRVTAWVEPGVTLWNASLADNLRYGGDPVAPLSGAIIDADLGPVVDALDTGPGTGRGPELAPGPGSGLFRVLGERGGLLSGGEAQRVRLGRARNQPDRRLVLLDEPFRGLSRDRRRQLLARARGWWPGATLLFITHDVADTLTFPRVLVVDGGRIAEDGIPSALAADPASRFRALLDAESTVDARFADPSWRRVRVAGGTVAVEVDA